MSLVLWSGGCDSTLVLYDLLKEHEAARTISIVHPQVPAARESQRARKRILKELRGRGYSVRHTEVTILHANSDFQVTAGSVTQAALWLSVAVFYLREKEDLYAGYIRGDDVWHFRSSLVKAYCGLCEMLDREGSFIFPLEWKSKAEVIGDLKEAKLLDLVWYCETPTGNSAKRYGKPCGHCKPCKTHQLALCEIEKYQDALNQPKGG